MLNTLLPILLFAALGLAVLGAGKRFLMWRRGRPAQVDWLGGLLAMPRRYLVDLHHVVERDKYMSRTHVATAGGFVLAALLAIVVHGFGLHNRILGFALLAACVLMFVGALFVAKRRRNPPSRLSKGPWMRLPKSLLMFAASFFIATLPVAGILPQDFGGWLLAAVLAVGVAWGVSELFFGMTWGGPMKHAFAGALHLAWHRRSERFGGGRSTGLKALDLNDPKAPLGVEKPSDFTWNQLLGFDACVQCGKCEAACPAFAAGQPLNPKKLIQDMVVGLAGGSDAKFAGSPYPGKAIGEHSGGPHLPIVNLNGKALVDAETLWSCTTCRACVEECPMMIEHVDAIVDMRRHLTLEKGATPNKGAEVLDFAVLGLEERDSGDVARRLGDEATFQLLAKRNIATLGKYSFNKIVSCDPHSFHVLKNEYGELGGHYQVLHHSTYMDELITSQKLNLGKHKGGSVTYHDPCYLGRYNGEYEAPRNVLNAIGIEVKEMERSGFRSRCCGGGGGAPITDIPGKQRIPDMRMLDIKETGAELVAVGCPQCTAMLEGVVEPRPQIKDIAELVADVLIEAPPEAKKPTPAKREMAEVQ
ncbi:MAG: (Fe-S)-binding protein [Pseudomonadales bacterium RIFCSPLOWO2_02_FULL_63_210]|nr:MAG: (Fe-S)-binding protein [Pseudomonadales bacterium RIFCSPLOWO2_02_FULL_63_210]